MRFQLSYASSWSLGMLEHRTPGYKNLSTGFDDLVDGIGRNAAVYLDHCLGIDLI